MDINEKMLNVTAQKAEGNLLWLCIDLNKEVGPSKSGKTIIVATSSGGQVVDGTDITVSLNIYKRR